MSAMTGHVMRVGRGPSPRTVRTIALAAMSIDHLALMFTLGPATSYACHAFGRMAAPLFFLGIAEGFSRTASRRRYLRRLLIFAVASQVPYMLALPHGHWGIGRLNVGFALLAAFGAVAVLETRLTTATKVGTLFVIVAASLLADWGPIGICYSVLGWCHLRWSTKLAPWGVAIAIGAWSVTTWAWSMGPLHPPTAALLATSQLGSLGAIGLWAIRADEGPRLPQWVPYVFYPAHLIGLVVLQGALTQP